MKNYTKHILIATGLLAGFSTASFAQQLNENDLKVNIVQIENSLNVLKQLQPITYSYNTVKFKDLNLPKGEQYGFSTQNIEEVSPDLIQNAAHVYTAHKNTTKTANYKEVDAAKLIPMLVTAIQEQQQQIEELKVALEELKSK